MLEVFGITPEMRLHDQVEAWDAIASGDATSDGTAELEGWQ